MTKAEKIRVQLNDLISRLPKKLQREYILVESTEELFDEAARLLKKNREKLKQRILKSVKTQKYASSRRKMNKDYSSNGKIFGLSTNPILLNCDCSFNTLWFTYLHEAGHLAGLLRKQKKIFNEEISDKIALFWYKRTNI